MLGHNGFIGQNTNGLPTVFNGFTFIHRHIPAENNGGFFFLEVTPASVGKILIDKPQKIIKGRLELGFHSVCVKVNVRIHGLNVHLIGIVTHAIILGIIATGVFNQFILEQFQNGIEVFSVNFNGQGFHPAIIPNFHGSKGCKVAAELPKVFTIIVLQDQNGVPGILLHIVFKVGNHSVDTVLKGFHPANQWDFLLIVLERDQGNPLPIQFNRFFPIVNTEIVFMLPQLFIRGQVGSVIHIAVKAI